MTYVLLRLLVSPWINLFWRGTIEGKKNIPRKGACIIAANHSSYFDFIILFVVVKRRLTFLAAEKFFESSFWNPIMKLTGQIRVNRMSSDKSNVSDQVRNVFKRNGVLGIFPEGTRSRTGKMIKAFNGAVIFSRKYCVPIIPAGIIGAYDVMSPDQNRVKLKRISVNFGNAYNVESDDYDGETRILMKKIAELSNQEYSFENVDIYKKS